MIRKWSLRVQVVFYGAAGINHFWHPGFYLPLIPDYLPYPTAINTVAGLAEILLAMGLAYANTRRQAAWGLVLMLLAFIPSHYYFIQLGGCIPEGLCTPLWVAWLRLVAIHPLLLWWAWAHRR